MSDTDTQTATELPAPSFLTRIPKKKAAIAASAVVATVVTGLLVKKFNVRVELVPNVKTVVEDLSTTA
jgi:hypothetical protein